MAGSAPECQEEYVNFLLSASSVLTVKVLEIGCYSGYSALAWHEATQATKAEIITLELDPKMIAASRRTFDKYNINDRVTLIEGPAQQSIEKLSGQFDIIFVDANKDGYETYVKQILDKKLLTPTGFIMCDNGEFSYPFGMSRHLILPSLRSWYDHLNRGQPRTPQQGPTLLDRVRKSTPSILHFLQERLQDRHHPTSGL